ncbi:MAG: hypothetical protein ACYC6W_09955 [Nitrosotalea sp.]
MKDCQLRNLETINAMLQDKGLALYVVYFLTHMILKFSDALAAILN